MDGIYTNGTAQAPRRGGWADLGTRMRWPYHGVPAEHATGLAGIAREELPELFDATLPA